MILIAKIKDIKEISCHSSNNIYNMKANEQYTLISIESPEYIIGFEGDDFAMKNFAI